ncbi:tight adherence protein C [Evansella vedderi]|uniref:Tight adherence protein C n=1 Tax=Evansella vedderi TaxID=38282 RepID=A0ABU0A0H9_9BACI|nr:type II secretion system F family protein [Evansella vedderi]MDQ0256980.1 tight adherence protein C [Evansella vedderi]
MLFLGFFSTIVLLIYGLFLFRGEKKDRIRSRVTTVFQGNYTEATTDEKDEIKKLSFSKRIVAPVWKKMKGSTQKKISNEKLEKIENKLLQAGSPFGMTPGDYRILQIVVMILLPVLFGFYAYILDSTNTGFIVMLVFGGIICGLFLPSFYLKVKTNSRNKLASKELPDFLDLVTVSIEAGLGFDSALTKVVEKRQGVLSYEFQICLEEMRLGKTRREALSGVRNRLNNSDVKSLIGSIIQAEQLGIGLVQTLRVQSLEVRQRRKQRAEEAAMKAPVKMLFPLVIFIFPCIFIVILAPAVLQFLNGF